MGFLDDFPAWKAGKFNRKGDMASINFDPIFTDWKAVKLNRSISLTNL
jgi:hypothetical protein